MDGVVSLAHVDQPIAVVQALPEQLASRIGPLLGMKGQVLVHGLVLKKHVSDIDRVFFILKDLEQHSGLLKNQEIALVPLVRVAPGKVSRDRGVYSEFDFGIDFRLGALHGGVEQGNGAQLRPDSLYAGLGQDQIGVRARLRCQRNGQSEYQPWQGHSVECIHLSRSLMSISFTISCGEGCTSISHP